MTQEVNAGWLQGNLARLRNTGIPAAARFGGHPQGIVEGLLVMGRTFRGEALFLLHHNSAWDGHRPDSGIHTPYRYSWRLGETDDLLSDFDHTIACVAGEGTYVTVVPPSGCPKEDKK